MPRRRSLSEQPCDRDDRNRRPENAQSPRLWLLRVHYEDPTMAKPAASATRCVVTWSSAQCGEKKP
jgi:hypothetical protein